MARKLLQGVKINGRDIFSEFGAKVQSYPKFSYAVDVEVFQGVNRSTLQLLKNHRGAKTMTIAVDFINRSNAQRTDNQSAFDALFIGGSVEIDIGDGYLYSAVLMSASDASTANELITTVEYEFRVVRHRALVKQVLINEDNVVCDSNVPETDCRITVNGKYFDETGNSFIVELNGEQISMRIPGQEDVVLDGINKTITVGGKNAMSTVTWTDFPYLKPGINTIRFSVDGVCPYAQCTVEYYPTYM